MVASRCPHRFFRAASMRVSTSDGVRYSRLRNSLLGGRRGMVRVTASKSIVGATNLRLGFAIVFRPGLGDLHRSGAFAVQLEDEKGRVPNAGPGPVVSASQLFDAGTAGIIPPSTKST